MIVFLSLTITYNLFVVAKVLSTKSALATLFQFNRLSDAAWSFVNIEDP
jgi:hypothetical protein